MDRRLVQRSATAAFQDPNVKIYVHGNCQAPALADLLEEAGGGTIEAVSRQVFSLDLNRELDDYLRDIATADVILTQPVMDHYRSTEVLSTSWIQSNAPPGSIVLVMPVIYHRGQLPQCFTLADYHDGRMAYHDAHALDFFLRGESAADFLAATSRTDFLPESFVQAELARTTLELLRRENAAKVDVGVSDIIAARLEKGQPLHTINHPSRGLMVDVANRVLERLGRPERACLNGPDMLDRFIMPPYLSTALALDYSGERLNLDDVRVEGAYESRSDFFERVFARYREIGRDKLWSAVKTNPEIELYLERFRAASRTASEPRDIGPLVTALYDVFFNRPARTDEILFHLQVARRLGFTAMASAFPSSGEFSLCGGGEAMQARFGQKDDMSRDLENPALDVRRPDRPSRASPKSLTSKLGAVYRTVMGREHNGWRASTVSLSPAAVKTPQPKPDEDGLSRVMPVMDNDILTIVIPMAGRGSRFSVVGYTLPKPLIPVGTEPMIKVVIDNLTPARPHKFVFICQAEHDAQYGLTDKLAAWAPGSAVVRLNGITEGAACTVLAARDHIGAGPLMIANSDQFVEVDIDEYLAAQDGGQDGLIMTMKADDPKWSYVGFDEEGRVSHVVEKEVISDEATVGIYNFASGRTFVRAAEEMIAADLRVNGEFYVAPVYNQLIAQGARIAIFNVGSEAQGMHGLGTPEDLNRFLASGAVQAFRGAA